MLQTLFCGIVAKKKDIRSLDLHLIGEFVAYEGGSKLGVAEPLRKGAGVKGAEIVEPVDQADTVNSLRVIAHLDRADCDG